MAGCYDRSLQLADERGWGLAIGHFDPDPFDETPDRIYGHAWNILPDGRYYDATASQFGLPEPYITEAENPCYQLDAILPASDGEDPPN